MGAPAIAASAKIGSPLIRYAVIDLAVAQTLRPALLSKRSDAVEPLFSWSFSKLLLEVGPWLVKLTDAPEVVRLLGEMNGNEPWGFYVDTSVDILTLRKSLRRYNQVRVSNPPRDVLFRYWDPRVMKVFQTSMTDFQRKRMFEWIECIEVAGERFYGPAPS